MSVYVSCTKISPETPLYQTILPTRKTHCKNVLVKEEKSLSPLQLLYTMMRIAYRRKLIHTNLALPNLHNLLLKLIFGELSCRIARF